jgi:hypothetical protein
MSFVEPDPDLVAGSSSEFSPTSIHVLTELLGISAASLVSDHSEVVILPEYSTVGHSKGLVFSALSREVQLLLSKENVPTTIYHDGRERKYVFPQPDRITLPTLLFVDGSVIPIALNIVSRWIDDAWAGRDPNMAEPEMSLELIEMDRQMSIRRWNKIEGTAEAVSRLLQAEALSKAQQVVEEQGCKNSPYTSTR